MTQDLELRNAAAPDTEVGGLLHLALEKGVPVETLERIAALYREQEDRAATREFASAFAKFQRECPPIEKTSVARVMSKSGGHFEYRYAALDEIARTVQPLLHRYGFSYSWDSDEREGRVSCTCTLRHENGHSESARFSAPVDGSPAMSQQQKSAGTLTYCRRQSLIQVLGLTTADPDEEGGAYEPITEEQAATLESLVSEVGADRAKFLAWLGAKDISEIPAAKYVQAVRALESKRRAG